MEESSHHRQQQKQLMQNCDLPPPAKLYLGSIENLAKALQLSQARARDAEARMEEAIKERAYAINALVSESMRIMAYRRWVMMLEIRVEELKLKSAVATWRGCHRVAAGVDDDDDDSEDDDVDDGVEKWTVGLVICLGLSGLGLAYTFCFLRK